MVKVGSNFSTSMFGNISSGNSSSMASSFLNRSSNNEKNSFYETVNNNSEVMNFYGNTNSSVDFGNSSSDVEYGNQSVDITNYTHDIPDFVNKPSNPSSDLNNHFPGTGGSKNDNKVQNHSGASKPQTLDLDEDDRKISAQFEVKASAVRNACEAANMDVMPKDINNIEEINGKIISTLNNGNIIIVDKETLKIESFTANGTKYTFDASGNIIKAEPAPSIFGEGNSAVGQYGGCQDDFYNNAYELSKDENIRRIINDRFGSVSEEQLESYLASISSYGCHFTAISNMVIQQYDGREQDFLNTFGYPMYKVDKNGNVDYNYEAMIADIHSYYWTHNLTVTDSYGNITWSNYGSGNIEGVTHLAYTTGTNDIGAGFCLDYLKDKYGIEYNGLTSFNDHIITEQEYNDFINQGKQIVVNSNSYELVGMDGTYHFNNNQNYGHAMAVTGFTTDSNGNRVMTVSERGVEYMLYPKDIGYGNFTYYDVIDF